MLFIRLVLALLVIGGATSVAAAPFDPNAGSEVFESRLEVAPKSNVEKPSAINGTNYTIIAPTVFGEGNNYSFIRFINGSGGTSVFRVTVVGSPSGTVYGTANVTVPNYGSPQYPLRDITSVLGFTSLPAGEASLSLYVTNTDHGNGVGFQHVIWNSITGFFENASICTFLPNVDYSVLNRVLLNVHTSVVGAYPSSVGLHNRDSITRIYRAYVYNSINGVYVGYVDLIARPNETWGRTVASIQQEVGYSTNQSHLNIIFQAVDGFAYTAIAGHFINNLQLNAFTNMSMACGINN